jgi:hypothetical protein
VGLLLIWSSAIGWNRVRGNRFLTLGIGPAGRRPDHSPGSFAKRPGRD